jgi:UDP-N-acetylglucosamine--N-acetylmuramyl-(pentapeptide) pyrophosphoryl-undecaprenol N-acetylglucosamine transferase
MRCVIAGGGTGGHLFPGLAIAEAFLEKEKGNEVLFIGTKRGIESRVLAGSRFPLKTIQVMPLQGRSVVAKVKALWNIPKAVSEAWSILRDFHPDVVLGVGGYASGPTLMAAFLLGIRRAIHEQNLVPGMTNQILKWFSQRIFVSFEDSTNYFPKRKTLVTGTPVRKEVLIRSERRQEGGKKEEQERFTLFIFGGSAGAHRINLAMMEALTPLQNIKPSLRIIHQTGRDDVDFVVKGYQEKEFEARVQPFFEEMAAQYEVSDLVICRAGASTIAELAVCGRAAIFIPYPHAAHQHQLLNAQTLVKRGAGRLIRDEELSGTVVAQAILEIYDHPEERAKMEKAIRSMGRPRAAQEIVDHCYDLLKA